MVQVSTIGWDDDFEWVATTNQMCCIRNNKTFYQSLSSVFFTQPAPVQSWGLDATVASFDHPLCEVLIGKLLKLGFGSSYPSMC